MSKFTIASIVAVCGLAVVLLNPQTMFANAQGEDGNPQCKYGMAWNDCGSGCTATCSNPAPLCTMQCVPRCECPPSAPMWNKSGLQCIPASSCPGGDPTRRRLERVSEDGEGEEIDTPVLEEEPEPEPTPEPVESKNRKCQFPVATGPCRARLARWYYNPQSAECEPFFYGGCKGNTNNFFSKDDCLSECMFNNPSKDPELAGVEL